MTKVLRRRLNAGELTQLRYLDAGEEVYLSAIHHLHGIYVALTSVGRIDRTISINACSNCGRCSAEPRGRQRDRQHGQAAQI